MPETMNKTYSGQWFVLNFVVCPNCSSALEPRPVEGEWKNVFCSTCDFACRFVVARNDPHQAILNIRKKDLEDLLRQNVMLPPLIVSYEWEEEGINWKKVYFFPFVAYRFLKHEQKRPISLSADESDTSVYTNMFELPNILLYEQPNDDELAEIISHWVTINTSTIQRKFGMGYARAARIKDRVLEIRRGRGIIDEEAEDDVDLGD